MDVITDPLIRIIVKSSIAQLEAKRFMAQALNAEFKSLRELIEKGQS